MYSFTNHFSHSSLGHRIGMMNRRRSGQLAWGRYVVWAMLIGVMVLACRHKADDDRVNYSQVDAKRPMANATRQLAAELDGHAMPWFRQSSLVEEKQTQVVNGRRVIVGTVMRYPEILCLKNDRLTLKLPVGRQVKVFINGQKTESPEKALSALRFEEVNDLLVYEKWDDAPGADKYAESYRVLVSTTHRTPVMTQTRSRWARYLKAANVSDYPLGKASTFSMNKLLEATFFSNKLTFVKRNKDNYLLLYDEYKKDIDLYINGLPVELKDIETVHVREVDKLYANERSFDEWADGPDRKSRFVLYIQTAPKRAQRDSTYYVFSPFYSGDF